MKTELDMADRIILSQLQHDAKCSLEQLADACGLSTASVQRRLKRLRDNKIIEREVAMIDPSAVGQHMTFIVMVELEREKLDEMDAFRRIVQLEPQVQQCYYVTGEADFTLICIAQDMSDFEALTNRLFFENSNVRRFRTSVVMKRTKVGLAVPTLNQEKKP